MKKKKDSKSKLKRSTAKLNVVEDMIKKGRIFRRKNWGYYWIDLSGIKDKKHPNGETPYELTTRTRHSLMSVFIDYQYDLKHGSKKNFSIIKRLIKEAEINGDDYYDFNEPETPCLDCFSRIAYECPSGYKLGVDTNKKKKCEECPEDTFVLCCIEEDMGEYGCDLLPKN
ncbi:MAG: hypothetical protein R2568_03435 [Candidatus Scalindua sp.]|jgi:hypothetical protein|nr:hypothetical protein [Candidatus Scalindua sp.]